MESTRFTADFCQKTVVGFCRFSEATLTALAADLSLTLGKDGLRHCQKYFQTAMRDPTVGELRFIAALAVQMSKLPSAIQLDALHFADAADARVFADLARQREALGKGTAPTPAELLYTATEYLTRGGRRMSKNARPLHVGESAYIAARKIENTLALQLGDVGAALLSPYKSRPRRIGDFIFVLSPTDGCTLADTASDFFEKFNAYTPSPLALIGPEGLGVHLGTLPLGAELDVMPLADFDAECGAPALLVACQNTLLLTCPQETAMTMLRAGAPLTLIGRLTAGDSVTVRYGMQSLLSLSRGFLATFRATRHLNVTVPVRQAVTYTEDVTVCTDTDAVLCGTVLDSTPAEALCALLTAAYAQGANFAQAGLGTVLSLPLAADEAALAFALSVLLPLHRFASELALSTQALRIVTAPTGETPRLTVFLNAPKGTATADPEPLKTALYKGDFATARALIYPRGAQQ